MGDILDEAGDSILDEAGDDILQEDGTEDADVSDGETGTAMFNRYLCPGIR